MDCHKQLYTLLYPSLVLGLYVTMCVRLVGKKMVLLAAVMRSGKLHGDNSVPMELTLTDSNERPSQVQYTTRLLCLLM